MASPLNLALLGAGRWARIYARTIAGLPDIKLAWIARSKNEAPDFLPDGCGFSTDWRAVASDKTVDGIIIATPPAAHAEMAEFAMRQKKPVLVEKPLTLVPREAEGLLATARSCNAIAVVEHTHLFNPPFREMKRRLRDIGPVNAVHAVAGNWGPFRKDVPMLWDWGAHDFAMYLDLFGIPPRKVRAQRTGHRPVEDGMGETYRIEFATPNAAPARLEFGNLLEKKTRRFIVYGAKATLVFDDMADAKLHLAPAAMPFTPPETGSAVPVADTRLPLTVAVSEFADAIRKGAPDSTSLQLGVNVVNVLALCEQSLA